MLLLSSAYFPPIQYFCKLLGAQGQPVRLEVCETFVKQTYRNRCHIVDNHGLQILNVPVEHGTGRRHPIRELSLSQHGHWQRAHCQAIRTAYGASPFFEYYWDELEATLLRPWTHLVELNTALTTLIATLIDLDLVLIPTTDYLPEVQSAEPQCQDWRYGIRPKQPIHDPSFIPQPYYQPFAQHHGFVPNASILDLLFNMGPESLLVLRDSHRMSNK